MVNNERRDRAFAEALMDSTYGWPLWKKLTRNEDSNFAPGCVGWMNSTGDWCFIDKAADKPAKDKDMGAWGPICTQKIYHLRAGGAVGANVPVLPPGASITMEFQTYGESQAILLTEDPVTQYRLSDQDERSLQLWLRENASRIVQDYNKELKKHGIWIITTIYTTKSKGVCFMSAKGSNVSIGLKVSGDGKLTLNPTASWTAAQASSASEIHADTSGVIIYFAGIRVTRPWYKFGPDVKEEDSPEKQTLFRGGEVEQSEHLWTKDPDGSDVVLHVKYFGQSLDSSDGL